MRFMSPEPCLYGAEIRGKMLTAGVRIRDVAAAMDITQKRVRAVRDKGISGRAYVQDWTEGIEKASAMRAQEKGE